MRPLLASRCSGTAARRALRQRPCVDSPAWAPYQGPIQDSRIVRAPLSRSRDRRCPPAAAPDDWRGRQAVCRASATSRPLHEKATAGAYVPTRTCERDAYQPVRGQKHLVPEGSRTRCPRLRRSPSPSLRAMPRGRGLALRLALRAERNGLENRCGPFGPPRVRIPPLRYRGDLSAICWHFVRRVTARRRARCRQRPSANASSGRGSFPRHSHRTGGGFPNHLPQPWGASVDGTEGLRFES
jgi:hypothetical protein